MAELRLNVDIPYQEPEILGDLEWKGRHLLFGDNVYPDDKLDYRDWLKADQIELESWALMFERASTLRTRHDRKMEDQHNLQITRNFALHSTLWKGQSLAIGVEVIIRWTFDLLNTALEYSVQSSYKPPFPKPLSGPLDALGLKSRIAYGVKLRKDRNITPRTMEFIHWWKTFAPHSNNGLNGLLLGLGITMSIFNPSSCNQQANSGILSLIPLPSPKPAFQNTSVQDTCTCETMFG